MEYTRNSDPEYYDKNRYCANCGSYALRLCEWYDPETYLMDQTDTVYVEEWIEHMALNGYDNYDITDPTTSDKELIAFNGFCSCDDNYNIDYDFHFKVFRDGMWSEKPGCEPVKFCELEEWGRYTGEPVYMYHKIDMKGVDDD